MKEYGILFSAPMIHALLNTKVGEIAPIDPAKPYKAVTRRLDLSWLKKAKKGNRLWVRETWATPEQDRTRPGRVAYNADGLCGCWTHDGFIYHGRILEADGYRQCFPSNGADTYGLLKYSDVRLKGPFPQKAGWRSSLFMPRWASRILLECEEDARGERLQRITEEDAVLEGVMPMAGGVSGFVARSPYNADWHGALFTYRNGFQGIWQSLHTKPGERWDDNPELARIGRFRRVA